MKSGWKTSEFWVTTVTSIVTIINQADLGFTLPTEAIATIAGLAATYILSRGIAKMKAPEKNA